MRVQVRGLTSADGLHQLNDREGMVVHDEAAKAGSVAVLLDGDTASTSISTTNLRKAGSL